MSKRLSSSERRTQIAQATLGLLANQGIHEITTRKIAKLVGISQPALFRHFRSREQILEAAVSEARAELSSAITPILERPEPALESVLPLVGKLLEFAELRPGLPRLLAWIALNHGDAGPQAEAALRHLRSLQGNLFAQLVAQAQGEGSLPATVDETLASDLLVAGIGGLVQKWDLDRREYSLVQKAKPLVRLWLAGLRAGEPATEQAPEERIERHPLHTLDVRPQIASGEDPLKLILSALKQTTLDGVLILTTPFRPRPLEALLSKSGHQLTVSEVDSGTWQVLVFGPEAPSLHDYSQLPPPEPMESCLTELSARPPGELLLCRVPRLPRLLMVATSERGWLSWVATCPDGGAIFAGRRP